MSEQETPIDFPPYAEITLTMRHVEKVEVTGREDGTMRLACRAENGSKIWVNLVGITPGEILNLLFAGGRS